MGNAQVKVEEWLVVMSMYTGAKHCCKNSLW